MFCSCHWNSLKGLLSADEIAHTGTDPAARPETISLRQYVALADRLVVTGDFNITFDDRDIYDPEAWRERILCSTPEREALDKVMSPGLADAFRKFHEEGGHYTWWDFRTRGFAGDRGLRIDHFLMSPPALEACTEVVIDKAARGGEKPSDHAPVIATLA